MTIDLKAAALNYAALGLQVLPVRWPLNGECSCLVRPCSNPGKHPLTRHGLLDATSDRQKIIDWWTRWPCANIGLRTGPTGVVLDVDGPLGTSSLSRYPALPRTWTAATGRDDGIHFWFKHPGCPVRSTVMILPGLDIRGDGAYVVAPPSQHVSGRVYRWIASPWDAELAELPLWISPRIVTQAPPTRLSRQPQSSLVLPASTDWAAQLNGVRAGQRHVTAARLAGHYLAKGFDPEDVERLLIVFAERCTPPHDPNDIRRLVRDLAARDAAKNRRRLRR